MWLAQRKHRARNQLSRECGARLAHAVGATLFCACALLAFTLLLCPVPGITAGEQPKPKNVMVLFSGIRTDNDFLDLIEPVIRAHVPGPITFYDSYLIYNQDEEKGKSSWQSEAETIQRTYAGVKLDLVIAVSSQAIHFAMQYRDKIFPGVPIVITQVDRREIAGQIWPHVTGLTFSMGIGETIDLALRLQPDTEAVAVISAPDSVWLAVTHSELLRRQDKVREIDVVEPPSRELLERVASKLPPHTVVLFQLSPDSRRSEFGGWELLDAVANRFPTYSAWQRLCLNHGCIGGAYGSTKQITSTGEIAARVLLGEKPDDIPIVHSAPLQDTVDWRALRRWHIAESALPVGTHVLYREPTRWERYKKYLVAAILVIAVQFLLILGLLWQRARKRKAEAVLRESEKRFRVMADTTPSLIWMCDAGGRVTYLNEQRIAFTGARPNVGSGDAWTAYVHPDDVNGVLGAFSRGVKSHERFSMEYRLRRQDGAYRWMFDVAAPRFDGDGSFAGFIGSAVDVTDQKMAQEALEKVSGQLIAAQEKERSHLARELHDDICQRLAMLSLRIEKVTRGWGSSQKPVNEQLEEIWQQCSTLTGDVQALSHELHPSILDNLGLVTAIKSFCREVSQQSGAVVDFTERDIPGSLPRELSLSLFRVIQEALHNAIKYSGQKHFEIRLQGKADEIELEVSDRGTGFEVSSMKNGKGLGLVSMTERIHLLNGSIRINSKPDVGTTICASVPLAREPKATAASAN
jgi:PAS domain S-box-containing protein